MKQIRMKVSTTKTPAGRETQRPDAVADRMIKAGIAEPVNAAKGQKETAEKPRGETAKKGGGGKKGNKKG